MGILSRLFKIGQAEANSAIDKLENPIKLTEQGIKDMKKDLHKSLESLAEIKAMSIRAKKNYETESERAKDYENKAMLILKKVKEESLDAAEGDRLATEALNQKEYATQNAAIAKQEVEKFDSSIAQLDNNVKKLKSNIQKWENELKTLKARVKVSAATKKLNKQMSGIDSSNTVSLLEKMKNKVEVEESLAESYGEMANQNKSIDEEINDAIGGHSAQSNQSLDDLKKKMGL